MKRRGPQISLCAIHNSLYLKKSKVRVEDQDFKTKNMTNIKLPLILTELDLYN